MAAERGYYDYSEGAATDATADQAFAEFESSFPPLRRELVASNFSGWTKHRDFLVRYSQMFRARSDLFRQEVLNQASNATFLKVEEVLQTRPSPTKPGETEMQIRYSEVEMQSHVQRDAFFKNMSITKMRAEIDKGAGAFAGRHWHLRITQDVTHPVITGDNAVALIGFGHPSRKEAMKHNDTLFVFPVCWQACLVGCRQEFEETDNIPATMLTQLYQMYLNEPGSRFAYSPHSLS